MIDAFADGLLGARPVTSSTHTSSELGEGVKY
jgi:hypothetical protein